MHNQCLKFLKTFNKKKYFTVKKIPSKFSSMKKHNIFGGQLFYNYWLVTSTAFPDGFQSIPLRGGIMGHPIFDNMNFLPISARTQTIRIYQGNFLLRLDSSRGNYCTSNWQIIQTFKTKRVKAYCAHITMDAVNKISFGIISKFFLRNVSKLQ